MYNTSNNTVVVIKIPQNNEVNTQVEHDMVATVFCAIIALLVLLVSILATKKIFIENTLHAIWYVLHALNLKSYENADTKNFEGYRKIQNSDLKFVPLSVNYHFTRQCNYKCGFCFHTATSSFVLPLDEAKRGLTMGQSAGRP